MSLDEAGVLIVACLAVTALIVAGVGGADRVTSQGNPPSEIADPGGVVPVEEQSGETVQVGVIGTGFDRDNPALDGRVGAVQQVGGARISFGSAGHDTAVAEIVAERSPAAELYLASVGRSPTPEQYAQAVQWLLTQDVDVIVDAGSYFPQTATGLERIERAAERAAEQGVTIVTSAGNYADSHWRGTATGSGWVGFVGAATRNPLGDGRISGHVTLRLYWEGDADYDLFLYRRVPGGDDELVAASRRTKGGAEAIDTRLSGGEYYVRVYANEGGAPVDLFAAGHRLVFTEAGDSSLPPATADGVISVGAAGADGERRYSSAGRDVTGPDSLQTTAAGQFVGSSAATPIVAGTVSSMLARAEADSRSLSPDEIKRILRETADGSADKLDPDAAIARVENRTRPPDRPVVVDTLVVRAGG